MKKNILALSVATAVVDMAGERPVLRTIGHGAPMYAPRIFGDTGCGHILLVPYYGEFQPWWLRASGKRNADQYDFREFLK